ncbi:hypothetical protein [Lentibacillus salicampi]|uniref:Tetratricopeptide repeat protein n=1 Tax=Lentibacillus salicampi TaxID=175306 RepID=A0A4Y9ACS6_9BACI|nr:hypothetical protein [Lentibacillus salicampi]TFJ92171.1 hypothetical protein E4U82_13920 [Lentibacillus salicampi]
MTESEENRYFMYSLTEALGLYMEGEYKKAALHLENAIKSANELHAQQKEQEQINEAKRILESINPTLDANAIVEKYKDSGYV